MSNSSTVIGPEGTRQCWLALADPLYLGYHDDGWGFPVGDDATLFEKVCLEGFQGGLSWQRPEPVVGSARIRGRSPTSPRWHTDQDG
jgi:hypothetical protein